MVRQGAVPPRADYRIEGEPLRALLAHGLLDGPRHLRLGYTGAYGGGDLLEGEVGYLYRAEQQGHLVLVLAGPEPVHVRGGRGQRHLFRDARLLQGLQEALVLGDRHVVGLEADVGDPGGLDQLREPIEPAGDALDRVVRRLLARLLDVPEVGCQHRLGWGDQQVACGAGEA